MAPQAQIQALREMADRHAREGLLLQRTAAEWLDRVDDEGISPSAIVRAMAEGIRIERLARGEPTERIESGDDLSTRLERFSYAELERLARGAGRELERTEPPPTD